MLIRLKAVSGIMLTLLFIGMLTLTFNISQSRMQSETVLYVDPSTTQVPVDSKFTVNVAIADVANLSAFGFYLGHNATVLDILDVLIQPPFEDSIEINETEGYVSVYASLPLPYYPKISGSIVLSSVTFKAAFPGNSILNLYNDYLICSEFLPTPHTTIDGSATVYPLVGGIYIPVNKLELLAPYIGLTILLAVAVTTVGYVKKRKRNTEMEGLNSNYGMFIVLDVEK